MDRSKHKNYKAFEGPATLSGDGNPKKDCTRCGMKYEFLAFLSKVIVGILLIAIGAYLILTNKVEAVEVSDFSALGAKLGGYKGTTGALLIIVGGLISACSKIKIKLK